MPRSLRTKLTFLSLAGYLVLFALGAKAVSLYAGNHPPREELLRVRGSVDEVHLGGPGSATWLVIASAEGSRRYSSWFGRDWPGMEAIRPGDGVEVLAEKKRLNRGRPFGGPEYYFWELRHGGEVVVPYATVAALVADKEAAFDRLVDQGLAAALVLLALAAAARALRGGQGPEAPG